MYSTSLNVNRSTGAAGRCVVWSEVVRYLYPQGVSLENNHSLDWTRPQCRADAAKYRNLPWNSSFLSRMWFTGMSDLPNYM